MFFYNKYVAYFLFYGKIREKKKEKEIYMNKIVKTTIGAAGCVLGGIGIGYGLCVLTDELLFNRRFELPTQINYRIGGCDTSHLGDYLKNNIEWLEEYGYERHYIRSDRDEKLAGVLFRPEKKSDIYIFCAHGYRSYGMKEFNGVIRFYLERGYNVFLPDHVASGESEGTHCTFGHYETEDCFKWLDYLKLYYGNDITIVLHGVSMGCATVTMMNGRDELPENVKGVIADCGFTSATDLFSYKLETFGIKKSDPLIDAINYVNKKNHDFDFNTLRPIDSVKNAKTPMFFIHGKADNLIPSFMAEELYEACAAEKKELLIVEGADHAQSCMIGADEYITRLGNFLDEILL